MLGRRKTRIRRLRHQRFCQDRIHKHNHSRAEPEPRVVVALEIPLGGKPLAERISLVCWFSCASWKSIMFILSIYVALLKTYLCLFTPRLGDFIVSNFFAHGNWRPEDTKKLWGDTFQDGSNTNRIFFPHFVWFGCLIGKLNNLVITMFASTYTSDQRRSISSLLI